MASGEGGFRRRRVTPRSYRERAASIAAVKRILAVLAAAVGVLGGALVVNALRASGGEPPPAAPAALAVDTTAVAARLAAAIAIPTVSTERGGPPAGELARLRAHLAASYPRAFSNLVREEIAGGTLLLTWPGRDAALAPVVLLAHQDVVPVPPEAAASWSHPPFAGRLAGGFVWGRGALDDKTSLITLLEAVEALLAQGFRPARSVHLVFGHDEEVGGSGAAAAAELLAARGARPALVLDEGLAITSGIAAGVARPVALIGVAEKGYASFALVVEAAGGHSSMPPRETAIGILAAALARVTAEPLPARRDGPAFAMLDALAPAAPFGIRIVLANRWLFDPLLERRMAAAPATDAMLRTTLAPTIVEGGVKENVLPPRARAVVNLRILPGDSLSWLEEELRRRIGDGRVRLTRLGAASEPSPVSDAGGWGFRVVARSVREIERDAVVAPGLMIGATDARHFTGISDQVLRFQPVLLAPDDLPRFHGVDERISIENLERAVRIYARLLENAAG